MFKVSHKDTTPLSSVFIVNFEHVIASREDTCFRVLLYISDIDV